MAKTYAAKAEALLDALDRAQIKTAAELAEETRLSRNTAGLVLNGQPVSLSTALMVAGALRSKGVEATASDLFEEADA